MTTNLIKDEYEVLQEQYDKIYQYFKNTQPPFDELDWNGKTLSVIFKDKIIETYDYNDLKEIISNFE